MRIEIGEALLTSPRIGPCFGESLGAPFVQAEGAVGLKPASECRESNDQTLWMARGEAT
jgi:hypothetical protein